MSEMKMLWREKLRQTKRTESIFQMDTGLHKVSSANGRGSHKRKSADWI